MAGADDALRVLRDIDTKLGQILALLANKTTVGPPRAWSGPQAAPTAAVASDADLDGKHGDPEIVAKSPRDWVGPDMKGRTFSQCPAEYLDLLANRYDWFAADNEGKGDGQKARYNRLDAARARGWAARLRAGYKPKARPKQADIDDSEVPF